MILEKDSKNELKAIDAVKDACKTKGYRLDMNTTR
jgi:hypothetical protein